MARRATYLKQLRRENTNLLVLFNGDLSNGSSLQDKIKADYLHQSIKIMGYDVFNVGDDDFQFGLDYLQNKAQKNPIYISANILNPKTKKTTFQKVIYKQFNVTIAGKPKIIKIGIIGIISNICGEQIKHNLGSDSTKISIVDYKETLTSLIPEVRKHADLIVVM